MVGVETYLITIVAVTKLQEQAINKTRERGLCSLNR